MLLIDLGTEEIVRAILEMAGTVVPCFYPNGHVSVATFEGIYLTDFSGTIIRKIAFEGLLSYAMGSNGNFYVTTVQGITEVDYDTGKAVDFFSVLDIVEAVVPCFLPDGTLMIATKNGLVTVAVENGGEISTVYDEEGITGVTVVPVRFNAMLTGELAFPNPGIVKVREQVMLQVKPGASQLVLSWAKGGQLDKAFGTAYLVMPGNDGSFGQAVKSHLYIGKQTAMAQGSIGVKTKGTIELGQYLPMEAKGGVHIGHPGATFQGKIDTIGGPL